jgi:hypothetical protein
MISTFAVARKNHLAACKGDVSKGASAVSDNVETSSKPEAATKPVDERDQIANITDDKLRERMRIALDRQRQFEEAPELYVSDAGTDEFMEFRKRYLPESIPEVEVSSGRVRVKRPELVHAYFGDPREVDADVAKGRVPVIDEHGTHVQTSCGMYMYRSSQKLHKMRQAQTGSEAAALLRQGTKEMVDVGDKSGSRTPVADGVVVEKESVTREQVDG